MNPTARALYDLQLKSKCEGAPPLNEFWKYSTPPKDFTSRTKKKPFKSWKQNSKEEAASWEAEKAAAKSQRVNFNLVIFLTSHIRCERRLKKRKHELHVK